MFTLQAEIEKPFWSIYCIQLGWRKNGATRDVGERSNQERNGDGAGDDERSVNNKN